MAQQGQSLEQYTQELPGTDLKIEMLGIPGGEFTMGSPEGQVGHREDEGPQRVVKISPFWMSSLEITWDLYYLYLNRELEAVSTDKGQEVDIGVDAVAGATMPYVDMGLGMGIQGFPVVNITQLGASKFCEWLSAMTGHFYRLPTEAEWEYACRAGTQTAYSFGDDASLLGDYAWYYENSEYKYQKGGQKKPNPWGLYDMHGNVAEWTLDQYTEAGYDNKGTLADPYLIPTKLYPRAIRGGSWDDDPEALRSAARMASKEKWKARDPQIPKSLWWNTDAGFVGFRIVRVPNPPSPEDYEKYWGPKAPKK